MTGPRYAELEDWSTTVVCRECSTRSTVVAIPVDEIADHDRWHLEIKLEAIRAAHQGA